MQKIDICASSHNLVRLSSQLRHISVSTIEKKLVKQRYLLQMSHSMLNFGPPAAEIGPVVWGTPANFNGFRVLAARHCSNAVKMRNPLKLAGVPQTLQR